MPRLTTADTARSALFAALIACGAFVAVPLGPVPVTLQVFFILLAALLLGPRLAALAVVVYLALGLVAPVYAGGASGIGVLLGPTGGFLVGFLPAVLLTGALARQGAPTSVRMLVAGACGMLPIYVLGAVWLALQLDIGLSAAVMSGVVPFVAADAAKVGLAAVVARGLVSRPLGLPAPERDR